MTLDSGPPSIDVRVEKPALALETAFLSTGLPREPGLDVAGRMAVAARGEWVAPGFVGVLEGDAVVGMEPAELERIARSGEKISTRDLPVAVARAADGGTTVAATLFLAWRAGVPVVATGGIGGVHPGPGPTDVSADLLELARAPVVLVCSGAKAILDLPATVERLESFGVTVVGHRTREWPAFWTAESGIDLSVSVDSAEEVAAIRRKAARLGVRGAILVCVPPPAEWALSREESERATARALKEAAEAGIRGASLTPWLLERIEALTDGRSLEANVSLLVNNARIGARVARALAAADQSGSDPGEGDPGREPGSGDCRR